MVLRVSGHGIGSNRDDLMRQLHLCVHLAQIEAFYPVNRWPRDWREGRDGANFFSSISGVSASRHETKN